MAKRVGPFKPDGYEVGYSKPPKTHRFQPGQSGNPSGRPQGATNKPSRHLTKLHDILLHEAYRTVTVNDKDGPLKLSVAQAAMRSLALKAAQGHVGAQKLFLESLSQIEAEEQRLSHELFQAAFLYKKRVNAMISKRRAQGFDVDEDHFLPHPDHVITDIRTSTVTFIGPMDHEDKKIWDELWKSKKDYEGSLESLQSIKLTKQNRDVYSSLIEETEHLLCAHEITILIRWNQEIKDVVKDPKRRQKVEDHYHGILSGLLNFDGTSRT